MWTETFEPKRSLVDGEIVQVPAIESEDGTKIVRGGITPAGMRIIEYKFDNKAFDIRVSNKNIGEESTNIIAVYLEAAFFGAKSDGIFLTASQKYKIRSDLEEALLQWVVTRPLWEPSIKAIKFL